jgi:hypothetical protein
MRESVRVQGGIPMTFRAAAAIVLAAARILLATDAGARTATYTYTYNGVALPIFRDSADIISIAMRVADCRVGRSTGSLNFNHLRTTAGL